MHFLDLPLELLPSILAQLLRPQHLASACLVNHTFNAFATPALYRAISVFAWQKDSKAKVVQLLDTLSNNPDVAKHVRRLEIRDFPKSTTSINIELLATSALRNCTNLRSCTWTRDGALTSEILQVLSACDALRELEINGRSAGRYDPRLLASFRQIEKLSLIMPVLDVVRQLPRLVQTATLSSLTLICKMSPLVNDALLKEIAPHLCYLQQLSLIGCPAVTYRGVFAVLRQNTIGIRSLSLEALPAKFNIVAFAAACTSASQSVVSHLRSLTLSIPSSTWLAHILSLLDPAPLEAINLYAAQNFRIQLTLDDAAYIAFWDGIVTRHAQRLQRVSVHRMLMPLSAIRKICASCLALKQLFVVVGPEDLDEFTSAVSLSRSVAEIHINFPQRSWSFVDNSSPESESGSEDSDAEAAEPEAEGPTQTEGYGAFMTPAQALALVLRFPESIQLFGCNSRVWKVQRTIRRLANSDQLGTSGELVAERELVRYDGIDIPEQFLVVRT
uniref:F-box domain-containing protein n=1 Tax=Mycena chlorophos TaxID=658473 RepID=A0ABQ0L7G2_MYCCL|nr:predicted protein [Mycena chlorophos]